LASENPRKNYLLHAFCFPNVIGSSEAFLGLLEFVCLFPFPYQKATNTESSFVFVAFSYPSLTKIQRKLGGSSFLLLFLTISSQKYNVYWIFLRFCCFFFSHSLKNATKMGLFFHFAASLLRLASTVIISL